MSAPDSRTSEQRYRGHRDDPEHCICPPGWVRPWWRCRVHGEWHEPWMDVDIEKAIRTTGWGHHHESPQEPEAARVQPNNAAVRCQRCEFKGVAARWGGECPVCFAKLVPAEQP